MAVTTTWDPAKTQVNNSLSNGNLTLSSTLAGTNSQHGTQTTTGRTTGKWYAEFTMDSNHAGSPFQNEIGVGICDSACNGVYGTPTDWTCGGWDSGYILLNGGVSSSGTGTYTTGDVIAVAVDLSVPNIKWFKNNTLFFTQTISGTAPFFLFAWAISANAVNAQTTANFGVKPFAFTPPAGYAGWDSGITGPLEFSDRVSASATVTVTGSAALRESIDRALATGADISSLIGAIRERSDVTVAMAQSLGNMITERSDIFQASLVAYTPRTAYVLPPERGVLVLPPAAVIDNGGPKRLPL